MFSQSISQSCLSCSHRREAKVSEGLHLKVASGSFRRRWVLLQVQWCRDWFIAFSHHWGFLIGFTHRQTSSFSVVVSPMDCAISRLQSWMGKCCTVYVKKNWRSWVQSASTSTQKTNDCFPFFPEQRDESESSSGFDRHLRFGRYCKTDWLWWWDDVSRICFFLHLCN